jgi:hypothetical protein
MIGEGVAAVTANRSGAGVADQIKVGSSSTASASMRSASSAITPNDASSCLSSIGPELRAIGRERGSNEHEDGQAESNFAYY